MKPDPSINQQRQSFSEWLKNEWNLLFKDDIPQRNRNQQFLVLALEWQMFVLTAVLTILNLKRHQPGIAIIMVSSWPFFIIATYFTAVKKNRKPAEVLYSAFFMFAFTYAIYMGTNDTAGFVWLFMMPLLVYTILGAKPAFIVNGWFLILFLALAVSPTLRSFLKYPYPEGRFLRYLFLYTIDCIISLVIMRGHISSLIYQNDYATRLQNALEEERNKVNSISLQTILSINKAVEAKDQYTGDHSRRVAETSCKIAEKLGFTEAELKRLYDIALLHDIGKIGINCDILTKTTKLTPEEYASIKQHTIIGSEILKEIDFIPGISDVVRHHHEFWDGTGYPDGLKETEIPLESRIIAAADSFDAMLHGRSYRPKLSVKAIVKDFKAKRGTRYDPEVINILLELLENGEWSDQEASDE